MLLYCATGSSSGKERNLENLGPGGPQPCPPGEKGEPIVIAALLSTIETISHIRIYLPKDLKSQASRDTVWKSIKEVQKRFPDGIPSLDPVENQGIKDDKFKALLKVMAHDFRELPTPFLISASRKSLSSKIAWPKTRLLNRLGSRKSTSGTRGNRTRSQRSEPRRNKSVHHTM